MSTLEQWLHNRASGGISFEVFVSKELDKIHTEIDQIRIHQQENSDQAAKRWSALDRQIEQLTKMLHDEAPIIQRFAKFLAEWVNTKVLGDKSKLQLITDRVMGYDQRFVELHKRLDEWDQLKKKFSSTLESFERVMKGETT